MVLGPVVEAAAPVLPETGDGEGAPGAALPVLPPVGELSVTVLPVKIFPVTVLPELPEPSVWPVGVLAAFWPD